jgi:hypothetical protein
MIIRLPEEYQEGATVLEELPALVWVRIARMTPILACISGPRPSAAHDQRLDRDMPLLEAGYRPEFVSRSIAAFASSTAAPGLGHASVKR